MIPTPRLRFVERTYQVPREAFYGGGTVDHKVRILQQLWVPDLNDVYDQGLPDEWRDVPLEADGP